MVDRDWRTEALAMGVLLLGWASSNIAMKDIGEKYEKFLTNPAQSCFGLLIDFQQPYNPSCLMINIPENEIELETVVARFKAGERTSLDKIKEVRNVNRGLMRGPVTL